MLHKLGNAFLLYVLFFVLQEVGVLGRARDDNPTIDWACRPVSHRGG
jgi:hypothetical protein